ncbi:2-amino-3-ketobutyrate coenzyme A ligase [Adhaeribacter aerolatus]|uniref:2-amino-3-ketobutyrate coenzyme A ligase n=1 Tax=Adhaeribacter aerolatus TaxID=670289 RepID=A0A512B4P7_9BACT|nr:pyridoxal phosphate-dependent aminotransferase family protein [Adhaeribacter aerolatus]GEO06945.1 2-amino-3-ketobutyrate coenzyme A ligase [Adhaeribacter aerolatus]
MDDFTSALYLGFCNPASQVPPWQQLTTGVPAALKEPFINQWVADQVAKMQGLERGVISPSSLHLFWDIFGQAGENTIILADDKLYAVARWGLERAVARGARVINFKHQNLEDLTLKLRQYVPKKASLLVVTDGWCPHCGKPAPLPDYLSLTRKYKGLLLIDDTQALGVLGAEPKQALPGGKGGGGLLLWYNIKGEDIITICSLAKGLGVPLSVLSGSRQQIEKFKNESETRVHSSPVSAAHVQAACLALAVNKKRGNLLRLKLFKNVKLFRESLARFGIATQGSFFPVQTLKLPVSTNPYTLYQQLLSLNIRALLLEPHLGKKPEISFCLTALHTPEQIRRTAACINEANRKCERNLQSHVQPFTRMPSGLFM